MGNVANPTWVTPVGQIRGVSESFTYGEGDCFTTGRVHRALGIPYAHADRYQLPDPIETLATLDAAPFAADTPALTCPQQPLTKVTRAITPKATPNQHDEHCQRLSITIPDGADSDTPVLVWIHGGGNNTGGADLRRFDPRRIAVEQNIIVVGVTYRIGIFGFVGSDSVPANLAIFDIQAALAWVKSNVASFGGNPDNVTVVGQSAGADLVVALMAAEGARLQRETQLQAGAAHSFSPLFRRAILMSSPWRYVDGLTRATKPTSRFSRTKLYEAIRAADVLPDAQASVEEMLDAEKRLVKAVSAFPSAQGMPFGPEYGCAPLPTVADFPHALAAIAPHIDVLLGRTTREVSLFVRDLPISKKIRSIPLVGDQLGEKLSRTISAKTYGVAPFTKIFGTNGGHGYSYLMDWGAEDNPYRACHISDLPLLWGNEEAWAGSTLTTGMSDAEIDRDGRALRAIWAEFTRTGHISASTQTSAREFLQIEEIN